MSTRGSRQHFERLRLLTKHARSVVLSLVAIGLGARLLAVFAFPPLGLIGDENLYVGRSNAILQSGDPQTAFQPPLWSYCIAAIRLVWNDVSAIRCLNLAAFLLSALAIWRLAGRPSRAVAPLVLLSLHPVLIGFSPYLWNETVWLALFLWAFTLSRSRSMAGSIFAGVLWGLSALTRQLAIPLFLLWLGARVWTTRKHGRRWVPTVVLVAAFATTVGPWLVRNYYHYDAIVFSTGSSFNFWAGNQDQVAEPYAWQYRQLARYLAVYNSFGKTELEQSQVGKRKAFEFIKREQPEWLVRRAWMGTSHLFSPDNFVLRRMRMGHYGQLSGAFTGAVAIGTLLAELAVLVWGLLFTLTRRSRGSVLLVLGMLLAGSAVHVMTVAHSRHRLILGLLPLLLTGQRGVHRPIAKWVALAFALFVLAVGALSPGRTQFLSNFSAALHW